MLHVYGFLRDGSKYFVDNPRTLEDGIGSAEAALKDRRRRFVRTEVKDIRALEVLWTSAPVPRPRKREVVAAPHIDSVDMGLVTPLSSALDVSDDRHHSRRPSE